jgi:hypothetical protein
MINEELRRDVVKDGVEVDPLRPGRRGDRTEYSNKSRFQRTGLPCKPDSMMLIINLILKC